MYSIRDRHNGRTHKQMQGVSKNIDLFCVDYHKSQYQDMLERKKLSRLFVEMSCFPLICWKLKAKAIKSDSIRTYLGYLHKTPCNAKSKNLRKLVKAEVG